MRPASNIALLALASYASATPWHCKCGYSVNKTDSEHFGLFTHVAETDFFHAGSVGDKKHSFAVPGWDGETGNKTAEEANRAVGYSKQLGNVIANSLPEGRWGGQPRTVGDAGLQLWVRSGLENDLVPVAAINNMEAIASKSTSRMLYGSYRAAIRFSGMNGTRGEFSWRSMADGRAQKITMGSNSRETDTIGFNVHAHSDKENPDEDPEFDSSWVSVANFPDEFHEYRFDWLPDRIEFYLDGKWMLTETEAIPDSPGTLSLRHYVEDGRANPPAQDAVMTVGYVKAYYNVTTRDEPKTGCHALTDNVCFVPDQLKAPNPNGRSTHFYSPVSGNPEDNREDDLGISHTGLLQPDGAAGVAVWTGLLFASVLLGVACGLF